MCKRLLLLSFVWMMTACASGVPPTGASLTLPNPSPQDAQPCPEPDQPANGSRAEVLMNHVALAKVYRECQRRQAALVQHIKAVQQALQPK